MKVFIADECNTTWESRFGFYMYGGIVIEEQEIRGLITKLRKLKRDLEIDTKRPVKWTNRKWSNMPCLDIDLHRNLKDGVLKFFSESNCKIIICLSPQRFYHTRTIKGGEIRYVINQERQNRTHHFGISDALLQFNKFLEKEGGGGFVIVDKFNDASKTYLEKELYSLFFLPGFKNIVHPIVQQRDDDNDLLQINDIVLGAIFYSLREAEENFLPILKERFWGYSKTNSKINGNGVSIFPKTPNTEWCRRAQEEVRNKFFRLLNV